jgi:O-antigen ligase
MTRLLLVAAWLLVAWGALAFGAVYPWAWRPLMGGAALVGLLAVWQFGQRGEGARDRVVLICLALVGAGALLQLLPLPPGVVAAISPNAPRLLAEQNLAFAVVENRGAHPLSIAPVATARALLMLGALTLLLGGLTRLLHVTGARALCTGLVGLGVVLAAIGIIQKAMLGDHAFGGMKIYGVWAPQNPLTTPFGPFVNRNHFAGWMLMGLPLALGVGLGWAERAMRHRHAGWRDLIGRLSSPEAGRAQLMALAVLVMGLSLLMTRSRSGLGCLVVAMGIAAAGAGRRLVSGRARIVAAGAIAAMLLLIVAAAGGDVAQRFAGAREFTELRPRIWRDSLAAIRDFPLTGTGLNTFGTAMLTYQSSLRALHFREAHNDYLQVLVEGGLLLGVPAAAALLAMIVAIRRRFTDQRDDTMTHWLRVGAATGLTAIALQSLVEFSLQMPGNAVFCVVLASIALHEPPPRRHHR